MKKLWGSQLNAPAVAVLAGIVLLLGVILSFRFVLAMLGVALIGWGIAKCRG